MTKPVKGRVDALKVAASAIALTIGAGFGSGASAQSAPDGAWDQPHIVVNNGINPQTSTSIGGALDDTLSLNGIGQVNVAASPTVNSRFICTGSLINPRTVLFAAHCVNFQPANSYGPNGVAFGPWAGGTPAAVGFEFDNLPAVRQWFGLASVAGGTDANPALRFNTNAARHMYEVEQVWYDPRSLAPSSIGFLEADIAIATLDTHVGEIPTWMLLFSPLQHETHGVVTGYGGFGTSATVPPVGSPAQLPLDSRRRAAENMISFLGSFDDRDDWLFAGGPFNDNPQSLYQLDFDDPAGEVGFNFDLFNGAALPREGTTAGGDSGGPLIADQYFASGQDVVVATLSGGTRFFAAQNFSTYGTESFYQPLFLFWEEIVENNPYVYAGNRPGIRDWTNPANWVQLMDPAYGIEVGGALVNALPGTPSLGLDPNTVKFGEVCFLDDCLDNADDATAQPYNIGTPNSIYVPGGPGTVNFVPNNVVANPAAGIRARYYDVTLDAIGETRLNSAVTIDRFTLDGPLTSLDVRAGGTLNVWGDFTVGSGFLNVNGRINSGEALLINGLLTGRGTFNPTFLTSVNGTIAPGGLVDIGTLTVQGDVVLASNSELLIELGRTQADQLRVTADPAQGTTGNISLGGDLWLTPALTGGAPRHGNTYTIVRADGARIDTFDDVNGFLGVLRPKVTYTATGVNVKLEAGSFLDLILHNPALMPFALALDELREDHYAALYNLYGEIDLMDANRLSAAFSSMAPGSLMDAHGIMAMQGSAFGDTLQKRLSSLTQSGQPLGLSVMGAPEQILAFNGDDGFASATMLSLSSELAETRNIALPGGMSAFISGGYGESRESTASGRTSNSADDGLRSWNIFGGVEQSFGNATFGVAGGYSRGSSFQSGTSALAESDVAQTAAYGVYRFDNDVYVSGLVGYGSSRTSTERAFAAGQLAYEMQGETHGEIFLASIEAGMNFDVSDNLMVTPNVSLRQQSMRLEGLTETGGETALQVSEQSFDQLEARFGARLSGEYRLASGWTLSPSFDAAAVANLSGDESGVWARFAAAPDVPFYLPGAARDDLWGEVTGGLSFARDDTTFSLHMESSVERDELHEDRYMARYAQKF